MAKKNDAVVASGPVGHAAHTKAADSQQGLRGKINRPINITFLGAGSGFCPAFAATCC